MTNKSFHSHIDRSGAISGWVAGVTTTHRIVFLASLDDVTLAPTGRPTAYRLYALTRYNPVSSTPLEPYQLKCRVTKAQAAKLRGGQNRKESLTTVQPVELPLLLANTDVRMALARLFNAVDSEALSTMSTSGWESIFEAAYLCASEIVEPATATGRVELEATIYYLDGVDLKLHSLFRIEQ